MWSTLREEQSLLDCFREFQYLYRNNMAHHFFWHWVETERVFNDFPRYLSTYEKDLRTIMGHYLSQMKEGRILPIAHINELIVYLLTGKKRGTTSCGVELSRNYDIVSGKIHACADLPPGYTIGEIDEEGTPHIRERDLSPLVSYKTALGCHGCGVHPYCGGRCPVQALTGSPERLLQYCQLMRLHGGVVQDHMAEITTSMAANGITAQDLYDRSAVIAQFTDVTP
jgi:radical SAM protein with 4Fe4S-binding SPASM domain